MIPFPLKTVPKRILPYVDSFLRMLMSSEVCFAVQQLNSFVNRQFYLELTKSLTKYSENALVVLDGVLRGY